VVAVVAAVLLSAGVVAATVVDNAPATPKTAAVAANLGLAQLSPAEQAAEARQSAETTMAPSTTNAPPAATSPRPAGVEAPPLPGHQTPGAIVAPFKAGRTDWSGVSNGVTLHMVMRPASPRPGDQVTFTVEASTPAGLCCGLTLMTGDGGGDLFPPAPGVGDQSGCAAQEPKSSSVRAELHHVYNKAGRWNFSLTARTGSICAPTDSGYGSLVGTLEIGSGGSPATSQGPAQPTVRPSSVYPYTPGVITLNAEARDDDGYVDRLTVEWGDGSATETYRNPQPCTTTDSGWPAASYTMLPLWMGVGPVTHRYASDAPHTVTVTVISTACDRTDEQRASGTLTFPEPLPPPPPFASIPVPPPSAMGPPPSISSLPNSAPLPSSLPPLPAASASSK
jgi:hypothetical protein